MKKFFCISVLVLMAALTLTSCGSDDKKDEPDPTPSSKTAVYEFTAHFTQDMVDVCDITMVYKDGDGKTVREAAKSTTFNKKVTVTKFPAVVGAKCEFKLKDGIQLTKDKYDIISTYDHKIAVTGRTPYGTDGNTFIQGQGVNKDKLAELLSRRSGQEMHGFTIDADGVTNTTHDIAF